MNRPLLRQINHRRARRSFLMLIAALAFGFHSSSLTADDMKAGLAKVVITPSEPVWLSGYSHRDKPAQGKIHDLFAKAAAFEDEKGVRLVLVTCDLGSVYQKLTDAVAREVNERFGLPPGCLVINVSHTHCAPEVAEERSVFHDLPAAEEAKLAGYIEQELKPKLVDVVGRAIADLKPAKLLLNQSSANFGSNRRNPKGGTFVNEQNPAGIVDHDVPVMQIKSPEGKLRGILFGYACHNTTLAFFEFCGDYAGFAQENLEQAHPEAIALFVMGCGGDQNPYPRHGPQGLEFARRHGKELSDAVEHALRAPAAEAHGPLRVASEMVTLDLEPAPPVSRLRDQAAGPSGIPMRKAKYLLEQLEKNGKILETQTCPITAARFGDELLFVFLGGETVIDYQRKTKAEFGGPLVWAAGYCNDVFAYLPSLRVLKEGGYEGREGIIHQLVATPFAPSVEERVMAGVRACVERVSK